MELKVMFKGDSSDMLLTVYMSEEIVNKHLLKNYNAPGIDRIGSRFCTETASSISQPFTMIIVAALRSRRRHYIFVLWFLLSIYLSFFPCLFSAIADWMSTILPHMVWL